MLQISLLENNARAPFLYDITFEFEKICLCNEMVFCINSSTNISNTFFKYIDNENSNDFTIRCDGRFDAMWANIVRSNFFHIQDIQDINKPYSNEQNTEYLEILIFRNTEL